MTKRIYISGPMTGHEDFNFPAFNEAADLLRVAGYEVENPADKGVIDGWEWADYLRHDLPLMLKCEGVAMLFGWHLSRGAQLEYDVATRVDIPVWSVKWWLSRAKAVA